MIIAGNNYKKLNRNLKIFLQLKKITIQMVSIFSKNSLISICRIFSNDFYSIFLLPGFIAGILPSLHNGHSSFSYEAISIDNNDLNG